MWYENGKNRLNFFNAIQSAETKEDGEENLRSRHSWKQWWLNKARIILLPCLCFSSFQWSLIHDIWRLQSWVPFLIQQLREFGNWRVTWRSRLCVSFDGFFLNINVGCLWIHFPTNDLQAAQAVQFAITLRQVQTHGCMLITVLNCFPKTQE